MEWNKEKKKYILRTQVWCSYKKKMHSDPHWSSLSMCKKNGKTRQRSTHNSKQTQEKHIYIHMRARKSRERTKPMKKKKRSNKKKSKKNWAEKSKSMAATNFKFHLSFSHFSWKKKFEQKFLVCWVNYTHTNFIYNRPIETWMTMNCIEFFWTFVLVLTKFKHFW